MTTLEKVRFYRINGYIPTETLSETIDKELKYEGVDWSKIPYEFWNRIGGK